MSLINDALRRAKEAQEHAPLPKSRDLPFRPLEPAHHSARRGLGLLLPVALASVALLSLLFVWQWSKMSSGGTPTEVNARATNVPLATVPTGAIAASPAPVQAAAARPSPDTGAPATLATDTASAPTDDSIDDMQESEANDAPAMSAPTPPKNAPLRLQAIVFNPKRPSAMISGKTLFIGDKLDDLRVIAIDKDSASLVGAGRTNILTLSQ
jgi:hypothetical protein